jgi:ATP-dependent DNA ligase
MDNSTGESTAVPTRAHKKGRVGRTPWKQDQAVLARIRKVASLSAQHYSQPEIAVMLKVDPRTVLNDRIRARELVKDDVKGSTEDSVAELQNLIREAWKAFYTADVRSVNRQGFLNVIEKTVMDVSRLRGEVPSDRVLVAQQIQQVIVSSEEATGRAWQRADELEGILSRLSTELPDMLAEARAEGRREHLLAVGALRALPPHEASELERG